MSSKKKDFYEADKANNRMGPAIAEYYNSAENIEDVKLADSYFRDIIVQAEEVGDFKTAYKIYKIIKKNTIFHPNYLRKNPSAQKTAASSVHVPKLTKNMTFKLEKVDRKSLKENLEDITLHN